MCFEGAEAEHLSVAGRRRAEAGHLGVAGRRSGSPLTLLPILRTFITWKLTSHLVYFTDGVLRAKPFLPAHRSSSPSVPTSPLSHIPGDASTPLAAAPCPGAPCSSAPGSPLPATVRLPAPHCPGESPWGVGDGEPYFTLNSGNK